MSYRIRYRTPRRRKSGRQLMKLQSMAAVGLLGLILLTGGLGGETRMAAANVFVPGPETPEIVWSQEEGLYDALVRRAREIIFGES